MTDRDALTEADRMAALLHKSWIGCAWNDEWGDEAARTCDYKDHRPNAERLIAAGVALVQPAEPGLRDQSDVRGHFPYHEYPHPDDHSHEPAEPGLDVERLARAWSKSFASITPDDFRIQRLAAEYARLRSEKLEADHG